MINKAQKRMFLSFIRLLSEFIDFISKTAQM